MQEVEELALVFVNPLHVRVEHRVGIDGVGSLIDSVTIHPFHGDGQDIQVDVPNQAPGEFGWTIDGQNGLVDLGTAQEDGDYFEATGEINPITRVVLLQVRNDLGFADENVRLAARSVPGAGGTTGWFDWQDKAGERTLHQPVLVAGDQA